MNVPFTKAHGALNDFLLTRESEAPKEGREEFARAICDRHAGIGADGWIIVSPGTEGAHGFIQLYNSDGSQAEISGNGTRCAAAFLIANGHAGAVVRIGTGAGTKTLRQLWRDGLRFEFEMDMGKPEVVAAEFQLPTSAGPRDVTLLQVGNPQCAIPVDGFGFDWRALGAEIERHPHFPNRTNVSFVKAVDEHAIDVRFWERGAGETMSSGTGSTGAAAMAVLRGMAKSPVSVLTPAGPMIVRIDGSAFLTGPAVLISEGVFFQA